MRKRRKRGTDHTWNLIKYRGNLAIYAKCRCGFQYCCSTNGVNIFEQLPTYFYPYCPKCGAKKKNRTTDVFKSEEFLWDINKITSL